MCGLSVCVCVCVTMGVCALSKTHQRPFTLLEKLFKSYLSWSQGSVKSKPCRLSRRCPALHARPLSSALLPVPSVRGGPPFCFFSFVFFSPSMSHGTCSLKLRREHWNRTAWGERGEVSEQRGCTVSFSADGWTDGWMDGMCKLLPFVSPLFCAQGCQKLFLRRMLCTKWVPSLWALFIWALVLWIPSFSPLLTFFYSSQFVPHCWCLGCLLMLFTLKWQSISHCCCFVFLSFL